MSAHSFANRSLSACKEYLSVSLYKAIFHGIFDKLLYDKTVILSVWRLYDQTIIVYNNI